VASVLSGDRYESQAGEGIGYRGGPGPGSGEVEEGSPSAFAVATLRSWWESIGKARYPNADKLLVCADGGGSNGSRVRAWKIELAAFAAQTGLHVMVCHLPPGTSKWNRIEHRLFSQITMNWRGRPLKTHQVIVDLISNTTTATGLTVHCVLDTGQYPPPASNTPAKPSMPSPSHATISAPSGTTRCDPTTRRNPTDLISSRSLRQAQFPLQDRHFRYLTPRVAKRSWKSQAR
jgi:hypothetical protein